MAVVPYAGAAAYGFTIVAQSGKGGMVSLGQYVSINDSGLVAFAGTTANATAAFAGDGTAPPRQAAPLTAAGAYSVLQINNLQQVLVERGPFSLTIDPVIVYDPPLPPVTVSPGYSDSYGFLQLFDAAGVTPVQTVAAFDFRVLDSGGSGIGTLAQGPFSYLGPAFSVNNQGATAFIADTSTSVVGSDYVLATPGVGQNFNLVPMWIGAQPVIADTGEILVKAGPAASDSIALYSQDLSTYTTIASAPMGFDTLGNAPGISDDGQNIAFYGDLNASGATSLQTTPGPGVFLAGRTAGGFSIRRIVGLNAANGTAQFSAFNSSMRVGVNTQRGNGDVLTLFAASDPAGGAGIWFSTLHSGSTSISDPVQLIHQGDLVAGSAVQALQLSDSLNASGQAAFWVNLGASQAVVLANLSPSTIAGTVNCMCDGSPIAFALVTITNESGQYSQTSDIAGSYNFTGTPAGTYLATVTQPNYFSTNVTVIIPPASSTVSTNFTLRPNGQDINELLAIVDMSTLHVGTVNNNTQIKATFKPKSELTLTNAACLLGYDHFNWYQRVYADPYYYDYATSLPYTDPPQYTLNPRTGKYDVPNLLPWDFINQNGKPQEALEPADALAFVYNEGASYPGFFNITNHNSSVTDGKTLDFSDDPSDHRLAGTPSKLVFFTFLVGVNADESSPLIKLLTFHWSSNWTGNGGAGGIEVYHLAMLNEPGTNGSGGISDIETNLEPVSLPTDADGSGFPVTIWPPTQTVVAGASVTFAISPTNSSSPLNYQWRMNGTNISGATNLTLQLLNVITNNTGIYDAILSNTNCSIGSAPASLTVVNAPLFQGPVLTTNGQITLSWMAPQGYNYQLQYTTNLNQPNWINFGSIITASNAALSATIAIGPDQQRFYRAKQQ